jgi:DNA-binding CsgD family transcriptional regulator/tetratricopeptide (TPR) repeat protein
VLAGREQELGAVRRVLDTAREGHPSALLLCGEPGIGKTSILLAAVADLDDALVLQVTGLSSERNLDHAGLVGLLQPVAGAISSLDPEPARVLHDLLVCGRASPPLAVGIATLHLLSVLAADGLVVVIVDDAQWIDQATLSTLRFAQRRLDRDRVAMLYAARSPLDDDLEQLRTLATHHIGELAPAACQKLLGGAASIAADVVEECRRRCGGNPLALLRLSENLSRAQRQGTEPLPDSLPVGPELLEFFAQQLDDLPERSRGALRVTALAGHVRRDELARALGFLGLSIQDLEPAEATGVVSWERSTPRFKHPLVREAASAGSTAQVGAAHLALARTLVGDRRVWHLASADGPPREAIDALVSLAEHASTIGAMDTAAEAWWRAGSLADDPSERSALLLSAGVAWAAAARSTRALEALRASLDAAPTIGQRGRVTAVLGEVLSWEVSVEEAVTALTESGRDLRFDDADLAATSIVAAANFCGLGGELARAVALADEAVATAAAADPITQIAVRIVATHLRLAHGVPAHELSGERAEQDLVRSTVGPEAPVEVLDLAQVVAFDDMALERWDDALALLDDLGAAARASSHIGVHIFARAMRGETLWRMGRWAEARAESMADVLHGLHDDRQPSSFGHATLARVEAALGLTGAADSLARAAVERGDSTGMKVLSAWGRHAAGLTALANGRPDLAVEPLEWIWRVCRSGAIDNPGLLWWHGDLLEALVETGQHLDARRLLRLVTEQAERSQLRWPAAVAARGRALLDRDADAARTSILLLDELGAPFEAARSRLAAAPLLPVAERATVLEQAFDRFVALGAQPWEVRVRAAIGDGAPQTAAPSIARALTPAELRVAVAVSRGLSNREIATDLALSPKTVDAHLRSIFRKLGLRSRTQLALAVERERAD